MAVPIPQTFYLSDILGHSVYDAEDREIGTLKDVAVVIGPRFPAITKIKVRKGRESTFLRWSDVMGLDSHNLILRETKPRLAPAKLDQRELLLGRNVLDKQMVDTTGRKIVRVNDVTLGIVEGRVRVTGVAIGFASILRRLGFIRILWTLLPFLKLRDHIVPWETVVPLDYKASTVKLNVQMDKLSKLHAADLAHLLADMSQAERSMILDSLDDDTVADIIEEFEPREQTQILEAIEDDRVPDVVGKMEPDEAADMLQELPPEDSADILEQMEQEDAAEVMELMEHERDTAGGIMTTAYHALPVGSFVGQALEYLRGLPEEEFPAENAFTIFLIDDEERLQGTTNLWQLLRSAEETPLRDLIETAPVTAHVEDDAEDAARKVAHYDLVAIPVVEEAGKLVGIITVDDALDVIIPDIRKDYFPTEH